MWLPKWRRNKKRSHTLSLLWRNAEEEEENNIVLKDRSCRIKERIVWQEENTGLRKERSYRIKENIVLKKRSYRIKEICLEEEIVGLKGHNNNNSKLRFL